MAANNATVINPSQGTLSLLLLSGTWIVRVMTGYLGGPLRRGGLPSNSPHQYSNPSCYYPEWPLSDAHFGCCQPEAQESLSKLRIIQIFISISGSDTPPPSSSPPVGAGAEQRRSLLIEF